jgi:hypothetical protein
VGNARGERKAEGGRDARAALNYRDMPARLRYFQSFSPPLYLSLSSGLLSERKRKIKREEKDYVGGE